MHRTNSFVLQRVDKHGITMVLYALVGAKYRIICVLTAFQVGARRKIRYEEMRASSICDEYGSWCGPDYGPRLSLSENE